MMMLKVDMMAFHWVVRYLKVRLLVQSMEIAMEIAMVPLRDSLMVIWIV